MVLATIIVGRPLVARASASASSSAFRSWPSMTMACQPKARQRRANCSGVVLPHRRTALAEPVDVGDAAQVVELVDGGDVGRLPHGSFRRFAVAEQHVGPVVGLDPARIQRDTDRGTDALPQRSGGDVDERQTRRRVTLEIGVDPRSFSSSSRSNAPASAHAAYRTGAACPFDSTNRSLSTWCGSRGIEAHLGEEQRGDDVGRRTAAGRVPASGFGRRHDRVDPEPRRDVLQGGNQGGGFIGRIGRSVIASFDNCDLSHHRRAARARTTRSSRRAHGSVSRCERRMRAASAAWSASGRITAAAR